MTSRRGPVALGGAARTVSFEAEAERHELSSTIGSITFANRDKGIQARYLAEACGSIDSEGGSMIPGGNFRNCR